MRSTGEDEPLRGEFDTEAILSRQVGGSPPCPLSM